MIEGIGMMSQASNPNVQRDNVSETLKLIQKQGLSVSIVSNSGNSNPSSIPATAENRVKQNVVPVDKGPKVTPRPPINSEVKAQAVPVRTSVSEIRGPQVRAVAASNFQETKATSAAPTRVTQAPVSEAKVFPSSWSNFNLAAVESKLQGNRQVATSAAVVKPVPSQVHAAGSEVKSFPASMKVNQVAYSEAKVQGLGRVSQEQRLVSMSNEVRVQNSQGANNISTSSSDSFSVFSSSNQARGGVSMDVRASPGLRMIAPKSAVAHTPSPTKQVDGKVFPNARSVPNMRLATPMQRARPGVSPRSNRPVQVLRGGEASQGIRMVTPNANRMPMAKVPTPPVRVHAPSMIEYNHSPQQGQKMQGHLAGAKAAMSQATAQKQAAGYDASSQQPAGLMTAKNMAEKRTAACPPVKKVCKKVAPNFQNSNVRIETPSSPEDGTENEESFFNSIKSNSGLTITPVCLPSAGVASHTSPVSGIPKILCESPDRIVCPSCNSVTANIKFCHICKCELNKSLQNSEQLDTYSVVTETNIVKKIIIQPNQVMLRQSKRFQNATVTNAGQKVMVTHSTRRVVKRRRNIEPECLTLSSDEEDVPFNSMEEESVSQQQIFQAHQQEPECSKSGHSSPTYPEDANGDSDDQFPGVTDINSKPPQERFQQYEEEAETEYHEYEDMELAEDPVEDEEVEEEEVEEEAEESSEIHPDEEEEEETELLNQSSGENFFGVSDPLHCRSVRIGSFRIHPNQNSTSVDVILAPDGISFTAPKVNDKSKLVNVVLKSDDITKMLVHFGRCLPIVFIFTTPTCAERLRKSINMDPGPVYYDPTSKDEKLKKITFLVDSINEEQRRFLRSFFLPEQKVWELDQKTANEILVKSTPNTPVRSDVLSPASPALTQFPVQSQLTVTPITVQPSITVKLVPAMPATPVKKLFTYPPPPQLGGITITTEDLGCLDEGEFLNDTIIDFYLKYVFYEKLSEYHREKTHIFSSYFFHRLTIKPERSRPGDENLKTLQAKRHNQVKTWTRHVDIFSKDFIIIPVNQNVHWFLAIICYPGMVPEAPESSPTKSDANQSSKCNDSVTSTEDPEEPKTNIKEAFSAVDGSNSNSDENSTASNNSMFNHDEETQPEAPDSSTHPDKNSRKEKAPCICIFDSLNGPNRSRIATMLREYLEVEWKLKKGTHKVFDKNTMHGFIMQVPQQTNYSDCGIYLLQYVESFFENPIPYFDSPIPSLANWFPKEKMARKRQDLKDLITSLEKKYENMRKTTPKDSANHSQPTGSDNR